MKKLLRVTVLCLGACSRSEQASEPTPDASATAVASSAPHDAAAPPAPRTFSQLLAEGRAHARDKRWSEATAAFERASRLEPDNVTALCELGWAALNAGDDARAKAANERALASNPTPAQEAQALYNEGRRVEGLGKPDEARALYERSLAARDNDVVQKRLDALASGHDAGAGTDAGPMASADAGPAPRNQHATAPCGDVARAESELRACLERLEPAPSGATFYYAAEPDVVGLPSGLRVIRYGAAIAPRGKPRSTLLLLGERHGALLPLASLGSGFESSGGARRDVHFERAEKKHERVWFVRSLQRRLDQGLGGLEVKEDSIELTTVCVLGAEAHCPLQLPVATREKLAYPNLADLDATERAAVEARIADLGPPFDKKTQLGLSLDKNGTSLMVTLLGGKREDVPRGVLGAHPLD